MARIRHVAVGTDDPEATAKFYEDGLGLRRVGVVDSPTAEGYYLSDGHVNLAILKWREEWASVTEGAPKRVGVHHIGFGVEDMDAAQARGLLRGYVERKEALQTIRGRIRFDDQIRRRFGLPLPVEVRYDEFTDDILSNRLVKAANRLLRRAGPLSPGTRRRLGRIDALLDGVSLCDYPRNAVPEVKFDRLNAHYEAVVALARLVLRYGAHEAERGDVRASGFTMDMNQVFQEFVTAALREKLAPYGGKLRSDKGSPVAYLDEERRVALYPDLAWQEGGRCVFVGDAKYKRIPNRERDDRASNAERASNADLYQILAYATALDLPGGMLVYAKDDQSEANEATYTVRHAGKRLQVAALDLSETLDAVLARVGAIAEDARALRARRRAA